MKGVIKEFRKLKADQPRLKRLEANILSVALAELDAAKQQIGELNSAMAYLLNQPPHNGNYVNLVSRPDHYSNKETCQYIYSKAGSRSCSAGLGRSGSSLCRDAVFDALDSEGRRGRGVGWMPERGRRGPERGFQCMSGKRRKRNLSEVLVPRTFLQAFHPSTHPSHGPNMSHDTCSARRVSHIFQHA